MTHGQSAPKVPGAAAATEGSVRREGVADKGEAPTGQDGAARDARIDALERRVALLEAVLDALPDPLFVKDAAHRFVHVNDRFGRLVGHDPTVMLGRSDLDFFPPGQVETFWDRDDAVLDSGAVESQVEEIERSDGLVRTIATRRARARCPGGRPLVVGTIRDVSDAAAHGARRDQELRVTRALLERVTRQARIGVLLVDRKGYVQHMSGPDLARMGIGTDNTAGLHFHSFAGLWPEVVPSLDAALRGQSRSQVLRWRGRDRQVTTTPVYDDGGALTGALLFSVDLAVLDEQERRQVRNDRMDSLGRLAGGVAHDLNNLLSIVMMGTSTLRASLAEDDLRGAEEQVGVLERSVERGARLSRQLAAFARRQVGPTTVIDLHAHLRPARGFIESLIGDALHLELALCAQAPRVRILPGQVEQIAINLALHAAVGAPAGSRVLLQTECRRIEDDDELPPGDYVAIRVVDPSPPLPEDLRDRIFEPFFDAGRGAPGMGLATCYGIARQTGGRVAARVDEEARNVVEVLLPMTRAALSSLDDATEWTAPRTRTGRILLAEDEALLREQLTELLRTAGHLVVSFADGRTAAEWFQSHADDVDAIVSDVMMPGLGGADLARQLAGRVPIVLMTGFAGEETSQLEALPGVAAVLAKPVRPDALLRVVQRVLRRKHLHRRSAGGGG